MNTHNEETIIITGSSGLIGAALADKLTERYFICGFDREGPPHPPPSTEAVINVDLTSEASVQEGMAEVCRLRGERIASVIHLASYYDFSGEPSPLYEDLTVRGTERLLHHLRRFQVEQFVFASTMLVHAPCEPGQRIDEDWPLDPRWDYPKSKVKTEQLIRSRRDHTPVVMLRISGVYNDRCHAISLIHQIKRIYERQLISHVFPGHISHGQSFMHLDDVVEACERVVDRRKQLPPDLTLLLGEPDPVSYDELQHTIGRFLHNEEWETQQIPKALAKAGAWLQDAMPGEEPFIKPWMIDFADDHYALDISRARALLDFAPKHNLRGTLPQMIAALKADPLGWYRENKLEPPDWLVKDKP